MKRPIIQHGALGVLLALVLPMLPASGAADRERWDTRVFAAVQEPGYPAYVFHHRNGKVYAGTYDTRVFAAVQEPGYPAYVFHHRNGKVYAGTYTNPQGDHERSVVREWSAGGALLRAWRVPHQNLDEDHGVQVATADARGRLVLLEKSTSSVRTLNTENGNFRRWATLPDLPICSTGEKPCSPNAADGPAIPNYAAWGPGGALFVTDYGQAVIWRIPRGTQEPKVWFASPRLDGSEFGTAGLVFRPRTRTLLITQQSNTTDGSAPTNGKLFSLPIRDSGRPGRLTTLWESLPGDLPDGFGIGRSGRIYIANAGLSQQIVVLSPRGHEIERFPEVPATGENGSSIPFDTPSSATFHGTRVLVANQSFFGNTDHHAILDVEVGERGRRPYLPRAAYWR